jgi:hypothetical protein
MDYAQAVLDNIFKSYQELVDKNIIDSIMGFINERALILNYKSDKDIDSNEHKLAEENYKSNNLDSIQKEYSKYSNYPENSIYFIINEICGVNMDEDELLRYINDR